MELKRPETFEDILNLQKHLNESIHSSRERTEEDIKTSMIAELIEFNEETPESHKTWKTKPYDKAKELKELTDVYFFFAQLVNHRFDKYEKIAKDRELKELERIFRTKKIDKKGNIKKLLNIVIAVVTRGSNTYLFEWLNELTVKYGYTKDDILNCYWEKWQKNMKRIGKEWN